MVKGLFCNTGTILHCFTLDLYVNVYMYHFALICAALFITIIY